MRTPPHRMLPLTLLIGATLALGACSSSDDDDGGVIVPDDPAGVGDVDDGTDDGVVVPGTDTDPDTDIGTDPDDGTGDDGDAAVSGDVSQFGLVRLSQPDRSENDDDDDDDGDAFGSFVRFDRALPAETLTAEFRPEADACIVETDDDDSDDDDLFPNATDRPFDFVSAGNALVFTSPAGTFLTLPRFENPGFEGYRPDSRPLPTPFPTGLTLDIGGEAFPAFASVPIVDVEALNVLEPAGDDGIAATTTFRWEAAASSDARVEIGLDFDDADDGDDIEVTCSATDDGEFTLPRDVLDRLPAGAAADLDMDRVGITVRSEGDALLVVKNEAAGGR